MIIYRCGCGSVSGYLEDPAKKGERPGICYECYSSKNQHYDDWLNQETKRWTDQPVIDQGTQYNYSVAMNLVLQHIHDFDHDKLLDIVTSVRSEKKFGRKYLYDVLAKAENMNFIYKVRSNKRTAKIAVLTNKGYEYLKEDA